MDTEYASKGVAGSGLGLGIAGTALGLLNGGLGVLGNRGGCFGGRDQVTQEQMADAATIADLRSKLALADAKYTNEVGENVKLVDVFKTNASRDREIEGRLTKIETLQAANIASFDEYRASQREIQCLREKVLEGKIDNVALVSQNGITANSSAIACLQNTVNGLVKVVIPNTSVCPGWGNVTITPAAS